MADDNKSKKGPSSNVLNMLFGRPNTAAANATVNSSEQAKSVKSDEIVFQTFFHENGNTYCCISANGQTHYMDNMQADEWLPFPAEWYNKGLMVNDDVETLAFRSQPEERIEENHDDREDTVAIPGKGEFMTYIFERKQNVNCYYDKTEGNWVCLPIKWELYCKNIGPDIRKVKEICPQWTDEADILATLRANNYNVESCIFNYTATLAIEDSKKSKTKESISTVEEGYNLRNLNVKVKYLSGRVIDLDRKLKAETEQRIYVEKKKGEIEDIFFTLKAEHTKLLNQINTLEAKLKKTADVSQKPQAKPLIKLDQLKPLDKSVSILKKNQIQLRSEIYDYSILIINQFKEIIIKTKSLNKFFSLSKNAELDALKVLYTREATQRKMLYNQLQELRGNIRVFCRIRKDQKAKTNLKVMQDDVFMTVNNQNKQMQFDKVFGQDSSQTEVYAEVSPIITSCADGYNVTIMAYGQTGSGKTFTMQGPENDPGVNKRAIEELLNVCAQRTNWKYELTANMVEIYNENVQDLLNAKVEILELRASGPNSVAIVGLTEMGVKTRADITKVINLGMSNRKVAATKMNSSSSRSHLLVMLNVHGTDKTTGTQTRGQLTMVDLAGSERVSKTDASGARLSEAAFINKSLSSLGQVFTALRTNQLHVPYRNSKLTHILEPCLGGDSKACLFVNVSPDESNSPETLSTLTFGANARQVTLGQAKATVIKNPGKPK